MEYRDVKGSRLCQERYCWGAKNELLSQEMGLKTQRMAITEVSEVRFTSWIQVFIAFAFMTWSLWRGLRCCWINRRRSRALDGSSMKCIAKLFSKSCVLMGRKELMVFGFQCCHENGHLTKTISGGISLKVKYEKFSNLPKSVQKSYWVTVNEK